MKRFAVLGEFTKLQTAEFHDTAHPWEFPVTRSMISQLSKFPGDSTTTTVRLGDL